MRYRQRVIDVLLADRLAANGAVVLEGPKACGKTETASRQAASSVRMDVDSGAQRAVRVDPGLVLEGKRPRLVDEWQLFPELWDHVRRDVDDAGEPAQFILTGSSTPNDEVRRHSGAGRMAMLRMRPMTLHELGASSDEVSLTRLFSGVPAAGSSAALDLEATLQHLVWGGWPGQLDNPDARFARDYVNQTVNVDINGVGGADGAVPRRRRDPDRVHACMRSLARNTSTAAGVATIADDAGLTRQAVGDYLAALRRLLILEEQPAFNVHLRSSRNLRMTPHVHLVDPSLAPAALGVDVGVLLKDLNYAGLLFESMVVREMRVLSQPLDASVNYFHTDDHEIDVIVQCPNGDWGAVEVKLGGDALVEEGASSVLAATASIDQSRVGHPSFTAIVTANGRYAYRRDDGVDVIPIASLAP